jgi:type IV pilus assembly protein PilP
MKSNIYKNSRFFLPVIVFSLIFSPICWARLAGEPVIIRKKISMPAGVKQEIQKPEPKSDLSITDRDAGDEKDIEADTAHAKNLIPPYNPAKKIDPFKPWFREMPKNKPTKPTYPDNERKPSTELEKIDLSQLKLTGIVLAGSGNKALVKEASGRGHVISAGTYIGIHGGRVAKVLKDRIVIKELMEDVTGRLFYHNTEMKLHRDG